MGVVVSQQAASETQAGALPCVKPSIVGQGPLARDSDHTGPCGFPQSWLRLDCGCASELECGIFAIGEDMRSQEMKGGRRKGKIVARG